jgi:hypothetical protein
VAGLGWGGEAGGLAGPGIRISTLRKYLSAGTPEMGCPPKETIGVCLILSPVPKSEGAGAP